MSFVGKILVVIQFVLSICFVAFAGVVYTAHMNWRAEALKQKAAATKLQQDLSDAQQAWNNTEKNLNARIVASDQKAQEVAEEKRGLQQQVDQMKKENGDLQVARKSAAEQTVIAQEESTSRETEANNLRGINHVTTQKRDEEFAVRTKLEDQNRNQQLEIEAAKIKNKDLLGQVALLQQALEAAGISADVKELATKNSPPPVIEGKVEDIKPAKRQGASELIEVTLGSDDGLKKGHQMTIYRSGLDGKQRAKYLAKIVILHTTPDRSVGAVIESSRNGVIQKGDNVTTKL